MKRPFPRNRNRVAPKGQTQSRNHIKFFAPVQQVILQKPYFPFTQPFFDGIFAAVGHLPFPRKQERKASFMKRKRPESTLETAEKTRYQPALMLTTEDFSSS